MNEEVIDLKEFLERVQDDNELILELLDIFAEDFLLKRKDLGEAVESKDYEKFRNASHSLKGASGNISAKALREQCIKCEEMGKDNNLDGAPEVLKALDGEYEKLSAHMEKLKKELKV